MRRTYSSPSLDNGVAPKTRSRTVTAPRDRTNPVDAYWYTGTTTSASTAKLGSALPSQRITWCGAAPFSTDFTTSTDLRRRQLEARMEFLRTTGFPVHP